MSDQMKPWTQKIDHAMLERIKFIGLPQVKEKNEWLLLHIKGDGIKAPESWNAKVYRNKDEELKLVVTDVNIFNDLMMCKEHCVNCPPQRSAECEEDSTKPRVISIDDSGWGFPIGGTLVGVYDSFDNSIHILDVPVKFYQPPMFDNKDYLYAAAHQTVRLLAKLQYPIDRPNSKTANVLFKVCTGYVNTGIVEELRMRGFKVETCAIGEPLQSALEKEHREYIKRLTYADVYYDPKELDKSNIGKAYSEVVEWIQKNNAWGIAKTGWKSMKKLQRGW